MKKPVVVRHNSLNLPFRIVKMLDVGYIIAIYFILGFFTSLILDKLLNNDRSLKTMQTKSKFIIFLEIIGILWLNGCVTYIVRNVVQQIPSPFQGLFGLIHDTQIFELKNASAFIFALLYFQVSLRTRMNYIYFLIVNKNISFSGHFTLQPHHMSDTS